MTSKSFCMRGFLQRIVTESCLGFRSQDVDAKRWLFARELPQPPLPSLSSLHYLSFLLFSFLSSTTAVSHNGNGMFCDVGIALPGLSFTLALSSLALSDEWGRFDIFLMRWNLLWWGQKKRFVNVHVKGLPSYGAIRDNGSHWEYRP